MRPVLRWIPLLAALAAAAPLAAQPAGGFPRGEVVERIKARRDTTRSYALYLPSSYDPAKAWPVLFLMDPRGRALAPMARFRPAAERHGWVILSSYNTLSDADSAYDVNRKSLDAMLRDAESRFSADTRRLYLGGFSGTARLSWTYADALRGSVAGIIGVGAGFPGPTAAWAAQLKSGRPYAFFATVGDLDFNYDEVRRIDALLDSTALKHRVAYFAGEHAWPPEALATRAVEWMQLQGMRTRLVPRDEAWLDSLHAAWSAEARASEATSPADALEAWRALAADFEGLRDTAPAAARAEELSRDREVRRVLARRARLAERALQQQTLLRSFLEELRTAGRLPAHERSVARLNLRALQREAADSAADSEGSRAARRMLSDAFALTASYGAPEYLRAGDPARALALLKLGAEIEPRAPAVCYGMARAHAQLRDSDEAFAALSCAVESGRVRRETLERDPMLEPLRGDPRFAELVARTAS